MAKNAVYRPIIPFQFNSNIELKRLSILFDKIYIEKPAIPELKPFDLIDKNFANDESIKLLYNELKVYEYLHENGIVEEYVEVPLINNTSLSIDEADYITTFLDKVKQANSRAKLRKLFEDNFEETFLTTITIQDIHSRIASLELSKTYGCEFYPILKSSKSFEENGKKSEIVHFILNNIPEPDANTPWEAILDFRKDDNVKNKYLKLISWINNMAISSYSVNDIKEEYESLYSDYIKAFKLHNMKFNNSILQILIPTGVAFFTGQPLSGIKLISDYISMKVNSISILQEEGQLQGKEIAYIYKAKQIFNKK